MLPGHRVISPSRPLDESTSPQIYPPSTLRAWFYLIWLSIQRQARMREMAFIAFALLGLAVALVWIFTATDRWNMNNWRLSRRDGTLDLKELTVFLEASIARAASPGVPSVMALQQAMLASIRFGMDRSEFYVFSNTVIFSILVIFLLPIWSLSFATQAMASEREGTSMVWLLTRPLSRPGIYLAKYLAQLPWSLGLTLGGFAWICWVGGRPGALALSLFWPAILCGTLAFTALFHLIGSFFKRPAIVSLVYAFFLEVWMGNMPGYLKRLSISFYVRCMMFDAGQDYEVRPESPSVYLPVEGPTACWILALTTMVLVVLGMGLFSRSEYVAVD